MCSSQLMSCPSPVVPPTTKPCTPPAICCSTNASAALRLPKDENTNTKKQTNKQTNEDRTHPTTKTRIIETIARCCCLKSYPNKMRKKEKKDDDATMRRYARARTVFLQIDLPTLQIRRFNRRDECAFLHVLHRRGRTTTPVRRRRARRPRRLGRRRLDDDFLDAGIASDATTPRSALLSVLTR